MPGDALGPWRPLGTAEVVRIFEEWPGRWWISGGVALELHLRRSWRSHHDSDVSLVRSDVPGLRRLLTDWDIWIASAGVLTPWDGSSVSAQAHQNNLWCRMQPDQPWCLDVTVSEGDQECWIYRRDHSLRVPWEAAVLHSDRGIPYLDPVLQLLYKSKDHRKKDDQDAAEVIAALTPAQRRRLANLLPPGHSWQTLVDPTSSGS
jgi:hypothetical protein